MRESIFQKRTTDNHTQKKEEYKFKQQYETKSIMKNKYKKSISIPQKIFNKLSERHK